MKYKRVSLVALLLLGCSCASLPSPGDNSSLDPVPAELDASSQRRLQLASLILGSDSANVDQAARTAAASELVALSLPQSREVLIEAIQGDQLDVLRAVLEAMLAAGPIDPAMRGPLLVLLPASPTDVQDVLGELLARHGQLHSGTLSAIGAIASDQALSSEARISAIRAIGSFRHAPASAAGYLTAVLQQVEPNPPAVVNAATTQLSHLTGLPKNENVEHWLSWWQENRDRPSERWLEDTVDALTRQATRQAQDLAAAQADRDRMAARLLDTIRSFWPFLAIEQQQTRLIPLLDDELASVRLFGLERFGVHLRDGHNAEGTQAAAISLLQDPDPGVRRAVALLLPELDPTAASAAAIARFEEERDSVVLVALLPRVAAAKPELLTAKTVAPLLNNPEVRAAVIDALGKVFANAARRGTPEATALLPVIRQSFATTPTPQSGQVLALIGTDEDLDMLEMRLDDENTAWRTSIAMAMFARGVHAPLLARANDPAIYPVALQAVQQVSGINGVLSLATMRPPEQHTALWTQSLIEAAAKVPPTDILAADDAIAEVEAISPAQRVALLREAYTSEDLPEAYIAPIAARLAPLVLLTGDPRAAYGLLERVPESRLTEELQRLKFESAIRGRLYDDAATVDGGALAWIDMYESLHESQPDAADLVRTEIVRRFTEALDDSMRERLGVAEDPMMGDASQDTSPE